MRIKSLLKSLKEKYHSECLGVDKRITLRWILRKTGCRVAWIHPEQDKRPTGSSFEHDNESPSL